MDTTMKEIQKEYFVIHINIYRFYNSYCENRKNHIIYMHTQINMKSLNKLIYRFCKRSNWSGNVVNSFENKALVINE